MFTSESCLAKPTGPYGVGYKDYFWITANHPDLNFNGMHPENGKNPKDYTPGNTDHCSEVVVRVYYPVKIDTIMVEESPYYPPQVKSMQAGLSKIPGITPEEITSLDEIKSYSTENMPIVMGKTFPVILFSPGFGCPAENYENLITELVSHGYIVVGINTPFINLVELKNHNIVTPVVYNPETEDPTPYLQLTKQALLFTYNQLFTLHTQDDIFHAMNLSRIALAGHSFGGTTVANSNLGMAVAVLTLDPSGSPEDQITALDIPSMYLLASDRPLILSSAVEKCDKLVTI